MSSCLPLVSVTCKTVSIKKPSAVQKSYLCPTAATLPLKYAIERKLSPWTTFVSSCHRRRRADTEYHLPPVHVITPTKHSPPLIPIHPAFQLGKSNDLARLSLGRPLFRHQLCMFSVGSSYSPKELTDPFISSRFIPVRPTSLHSPHR